MYFHNVQHKYYNILHVVTNLSTLCTILYCLVKIDMKLFVLNAIFVTRLA